MATHDHIQSVDALDLFSALSSEERSDIARSLQTISLKRGAVLIEEGAVADELYLVVSGRFSVTKRDSNGGFYEIGAGQPIGEIAFFAGGQRTATVTALRDSLVLRLDRNQFDKLVERNPSIWPKLTANIARRLSQSSGKALLMPGTRPRTITVIRAGGSSIPPAFVRHLVHVFTANAKTKLIGPRSAREVISQGIPFESPEAVRALNALEANSDFVIFFADHDATEWSEKTIRQADLVLMVGHHAADPTPNALEQFAAHTLPPAARRLVLLHPQRLQIKDTARWLEKRQVAMHHHVALDSEKDTARLYRFIAGTARGLVACGGGALCAAHTGVWRALLEAGFEFDIMGGTSAGSAFSAGFAMGSQPSDIQAAVHDIFVQNRAMGRYTLPLYGLLDHVNFDVQLKRHFGGIDIEDLWIPFFSVATDLSSYALHCQMRGPLWSAIRASSSIPVLFPPYYTRDGRMLVDGCLLDNVPVKVMRSIKQGPNVVITFSLPEFEKFAVDYDALPTRSDIFRSAIRWQAARKTQDIPGIAAVLMRSLMANRNDFRQHLTPDDLLLVPPIPAQAGFLDWHRHLDLARSAYEWTRTELSSPEIVAKWLPNTRCSKSV